MILVVTSDFDSNTHYLVPGGHTKGCGRKVALCGEEVFEEAVQPEGTKVTCWHCNKGYSLGIHLITTGRPKNPKGESDDSTNN